MNSESTFVAPNYVVDSFDQLEDLKISDLDNLEIYRNLKMRENEGEILTPEEQAQLATLETVFENKVVTAARWNKFQNALVGMQNFIKNEVEGYVDAFQVHVDTKTTEVNTHVNTKTTEINNYVDTKTTEINNYVDTKTGELDAEIDKFKYRGDYNPVVTYFERNVVSFNDGAGSKEYLCLVDNTIGIDPTNTSNWRLLTIKGEQGEPGVGIGITFRGAWDVGAIYNKDDGVQYGGLLFASLIDANQGIEPNLAEDNAYWARVLNVGVTTTKWEGLRTVVTETSNVNFITGEIVAFNPSVDHLEVFVNTTKLAKGRDYTLNANLVSIDKVSGLWDGRVEPVYFEFVVYKNIVNDLVFKDGQSIENGTITADKMAEGVLPVISATEPPTPTLNQLWVDIS